MNFRNRTIYLLIVLMIMVPAISGCITTFNPKTTMVRTMDFFKPSFTRYHKKIGITRFENTTRFNAPKMITFINKNLMDVLNDKYPELILVEETENAFSDLKNRFPLLPTGEIDNLALAQRGRQLDLNAIVVGTISDIKGYEKKQGFWFFRKPVQYIEVHIMVTVYDTQTSGKILEQWISREIEVDREILDKFNAVPAEIPLNVIEEGLTFLTKKAGGDIGYLLKHQPFKAYIKSISNNRVTIGAGETSRIVPGTVFNVYDSSKIINGKDGQRFILPGGITGTIKISEVFPETSVGQIEDGKIAGMGSCLIPKY